MDFNQIITFKRDTSFRKQFFVPNSFAHPAKMDAQFLIWIVEHYTEAGETILDPMAGSGTTMLACGLGRNVILVELEEKFCKMMRDNWGQARMKPQLGSTMGACQIIQGDARNLERIRVDKCVFSPPYAETGVGDWQTGRADFQRWVLEQLETKGYIEWQGKRYTESEWRAMNHGRIDGRTTKGVHKHPTNGYGAGAGQVGNLPYGQIDKIITSPPYEGSIDPHNENWDGIKRFQSGETRESILEDRRKGKMGYSVDSIITSPPYENQVHKGSGEWSKSLEGRLLGGEQSSGGKMLGVPQGEDYIKSQENIGNLKSDSYLSAMLQVYQQCHKVLKPQGLMILVTKNFIRDQKEIRLDLDTIKLCEQAGFTFKERWYRELPAQSFWRIIYKQKYPDAPELKYEDVLVFLKA